MGRIGAVAIVGAGIAGIQASLDLADQGFKIYIVEKTSSIGGRMAQLDRTFPTLDCSICILSPKMVEVGRHPNIELLTLSEVVGLEGEAGNFKVKVKKKPRYVDERKCTGCGDCAIACPYIKFPHEFNVGLELRGNAYIPFLQAVPLVYVIDREHCVNCGNCVAICGPEAIDFNQKTETITIDVGSVIISTGFDLIDPGEIREYGYDYDDVITALEYERLISASGPTGGEIIRLSDKKHAKKIAFIQCVGSRDCRAKEYCSSVCCAYATKEAVISKEHGIEDCHIFYMDMRMYGKGFEEFYRRAEREYGVKYHKSWVAEIQEGTDGILIRYEDIEKGEVIGENYDLVVLCNALKPSESLMGLAEVLDVELDENGFIKTGSSPVETSRDGIFVCGFAENPKDIPESVAQASGAAAKVASLLHSERKTLTEEVELSPEKEVVGTEPRVGAFICHCGINIGGVVDVPMVTEYVKMLPNVVYTEENLYICSEEAQDCIKRAIKEQDLNRVVVAGCTPRTHETLFRNTCAEAGLNPYLFEFANIREHCSWVHMYEPELATEKAKDLIRMTIAKAKLLEPLKGIEIPVEPAALVIGGGVSGLTAAIDIAEQGFGVHLIEKEEELGGLVNQLYNQVDGVNPKEIVDDLIKRVELNDVTVHKNTKLKELSGFVGNFRATLDDKAELNVGAIIVAIGANELKSEEYGYGETENVITLLDLEKKLKDGFKPPDDITFLLCVGCRNEEHPYCSRYCCNAAIKNVLLLKELNPNASIKVMHRDIRTYGEYEKYYTKAIEQGVTFIRYEDYPRIEPEKDKIRIRVKDILSDLEIEEYSDLFVLVTPLVPQEDVEELSKMLKVPLNENGFFLEAHVKLRPVEFATDGIFLCGTCHSPKMMEESITQASGAASHASITLSKGFVAAEAITSSVDEEKCIGCGVCESVCPYGAIEVVENIAKVTEVKCKGCGCCGSSCIKRAITMRHFSDEQLIAQASTALEAT